MTARTPEEVVAEALVISFPGIIWDFSDVEPVVAALRSAGLLAEPVDGDAREALAEALAEAGTGWEFDMSERETPGSSIPDPGPLAEVLTAAVVAAGWRPLAPVGDDAVERAARALNLAGWTCEGGGDELGRYDECEDCRRVTRPLARAALEAAANAPTDPAVVLEGGGDVATPVGPDLHQVIDELKAQLEPEWEYGLKLDEGWYSPVIHDTADAALESARDWGPKARVVRRPRVRPWEPVPSTEGDDR